MADTRETKPKIQRQTGLSPRAGAALADRRANRAAAQPLIPGAGGGSAGTTSVPMVNPEHLADNPRNQKERTKDLENLENVAEFGVLEPILVTPTEVFTTAFPAYAAVIGDAPYVILAGHRRKAAALEFGTPDGLVPIYVRHDLSADGRDAAVRILENQSRTNLDPIAEALDYQRLRDENGMGVRAIGDWLRKSHSHISKRLSLLTLPAPLQQAVVAGSLTSSYAETIARTLGTAEDQLRAWRLLQGDVPLGQALVDATSEDATERALSAHGLPDEADPDPVQTAVAGVAPEAGEVAAQRSAASPDSRGPVQQPGPGRPSSAVSGGNAARDAASRRWEWCEHLAVQEPDADHAAQAIARHCLSGAPYQRDAIRIAHRWLRAAKVGPHDLADPGAYMAAAVQSSDLVRVAYVVALAADEARMRDPRRSWDLRDLMHMERLRAAGYTPTPWENGRLNAVTR